jgi:hypothetical protein
MEATHNLPNLLGFEISIIFSHISISAYSQDNVEYVNEEMVYSQADADLG